MKIIYSFSISFFISISCIHAQYTNIPDLAFEQTLIELGFDDDGLNGKVKTVLISEIDTLNLATRSINNAIGIEDFTALKVLFLTGNPITQLDLNKNKNLVWLSADFCQLHQLQLTECTKLKYLTIQNNNLTALDLSSLNNLEVLTASKNNFTALDISHNQNLNSLSLSFSKLVSLNTTKNTSLEYFYCNNTPLNELDLSYNLELKQLNCTQTPSLFSICVPNKHFANSNSEFEKDSNDTWIDDCNVISFINKHEQILLNKIYPNPSSGRFTIEAEYGSVVTIVDVLGREIFRTTINSEVSTIQLDDTKKGLFIIHIQNKNLQTQQTIKIE